MDVWEQVLILLFILLGLVSFIKGYYEVRKRKNPFGLAGSLVFLGIFVWGDAYILGLFWILLGLMTLILQDWMLFLLALAIFWSVRSGGEVIYWLNEQFAPGHRNPPTTLKFHKIFPGDSIWFIYQLFWQCVLVISLISSIYISLLLFKSL